MNRTLSMLVIVTTLAGCTSQPTVVDPNYAAFVDAQKTIALNKPEQPLIRIKAMPGQQIEMKGVEEFVVFAPGRNEQRSVVGQYQAPHNEWAEVAKATLPVIGMIGGIWAAGDAVSNLAKAVGDSSNAGYQYVQAPQANNSIGGNGVIGNGSYEAIATTSTLTGTGAVNGAFTPTVDGGTLVGDYSNTPTLTGTGAVNGAFTPKVDGGTLVGDYSNTPSLRGTGTLSGDYTVMPASAP